MANTSSRIDYPKNSGEGNQASALSWKINWDGSFHFSHPQNQHDDVWWSTALALSCGVKLAPDPFLAVVPRTMYKRGRTH